MSPTKSLHSTTQQLETPMSFEQFEFHLRNMYFKAGQSFGNHDVLVCGAV